jgi:hypothetical protein
MTWVLILWSALIVVWIAAGASSTHCNGTYGSACNAGKGIGVGIILVFGFLGFIVLSLIWFMTRPRTRDCPACGSSVKRGVTVCPTCGHDFAAAAARHPHPGPA